MGPYQFLDQARRVTLINEDGTSYNGGASGSGTNTSPTYVTSAQTPQGGYFAPTASANGTELPNRPAKTNGVRLELNSGASITYYVAATGQTPSAAPAYTKTVNVAGTTDEPLSATDSIYVTAVTGTVIGRWVQR